METDPHSKNNCVPTKESKINSNSTSTPAKVEPELREYFSILIESVKDYAMFVVDLQGRMISWNPGVERILGYSEEEFLKLEVAAIFLPEDRAAGSHIYELQVALQQGRALDQRWHLRKDGVTFWADGVVTAVKNTEGEATCFVKIMRDATEGKRQNDALKAREAELFKANQVKDVFIATLSHELRNPLNIIMGFTEILKEEIDPSNLMQLEAIEAIERSAKLQNQLVNDLLDVSRIIAGKFHIDRQWVAYTPLLESVLAAAKVSAHKKQIQIFAKLDLDCGLIEADAGRLQQVIMNILNNAIKFTPEGGRIDIVLQANDREVQLTIKDSGKGISPEFLPFVFDRFRQQQGDANRKHGGLGLGLAIARELVELHGGRLEAQSEGDGLGASFILTLPRLSK